MIVENIETIIQRITTESPETEIFVQSVLPRGGDYRDSVESLNAAIKESITDTANWVNIYPAFLAADGSINDELSNDELHLHGKGYIVWRDLIAELVHTTVSKNSSGG